MYIQRIKAFNFAVSEVGMGDMRGVGGRRHERRWGKCSYVFIKMKKLKKSKADSTGLPRDELFAFVKWKSIY